MIPEVNIISEKASVVSVSGAGGSGGCSESLSRDFRGQSCLRNFFGSKEHLDQFEIDLDVAEIITVQDYKCKKKLMWMEVHIYSVKAKI